MRNQTILFLGLFGMTLAAGCTITTTDGLNQGGMSGTGLVGSGGATATGGTTSTGGTTATAGAAGTTTVTTFTAAQCPAAATTVPASVPDVTSACIDCIYTTACTEAVACHNDDGCMTSTLQALECIRLYYLYNQELVMIDDVQACEEGSLTSANTPSDGATAVNPKSTDPSAWLGALVPSKGTAIVTQCDVKCNLAE